jgi:integral membrane protein
MTEPVAPPASPRPGPPPGTAKPRALGALKRYRFMAFFTGVMLLIATFVGIPVQIWGNLPWLVTALWIIHGYGFIVYLVTVADLGLRLRWHIVRIVLVAVAGTVPFCSFIAEHNIMGRVRADHPELAR